MAKFGTFKYGEEKYGSGIIARGTRSDKKTRAQAIPFEAKPFYFGDPNNPDADNDSIIDSDLFVYIRCVTPSHLNLVEAYLNMRVVVGSVLTVKIAIGEFASDGRSAQEDYTQGDINLSHQKLTGGDSAISSSGGVLFIDGLNILPEIPRRGDSIFNEDGFVLILQFSRARISGDSLSFFDVPCSALMGLYQ